MAHRLVHRANLLVFETLTIILLVLGAAIWDRLDAAHSARVWSQHSYAVLGALDDLDLSIHDAETGQRGYLLTGRQDYLQPYTRALGEVILLEGELEKLTDGEEFQQARLHALAPILQSELNQLAETVELRREFGLEAALPIVNTDLGLKAMTQIEATIASMSALERHELDGHVDALNHRADLVRLFVLGGTMISVFGLLLAARMLNKAWRRSRGIEERQRSLIMRLRTSLDSLSQGVAVFDAEAELTNWNEKFRLLLGLPEEMVRSGASYAVFAGSAAARGIAMEREDRFLSGAHAARGAGLYEQTRDDGRQLELRRTQMPDGGFVLTISDMTERVQAESVLREAQKMQAIGQLTGGIAHDFNNLLTVILGNLEVLRRKLESEPGLQVRIDRGIWAAQRGATLTSQLLSFARKQPLAPAPIDLAAAISDLVPLLGRILGERINIRYVESDGLWAAMADAVQLESALRNLVLNARDAMPSGGRLTIELGNKVLTEDDVRSSVDMTPGDYIVLAVSDTGHGMSPEVMQRAFEPFFTTKPIGKGTGLGLAVVFGFVKQSGGQVEIESELGEGTTVRIYLPRAMTEAPVVRSGGPAIALPRGNGTILVVEDEAAVREIAVMTLRDLGYRVFEAASAEEAFRSFDLHGSEIDLLLTDIILPGKVRGSEVAERVTALRPSVRVLFMSGYTDNALVERERRDGGGPFIGKPFSQEQLARKVAAVLGVASTALEIELTASGNVIGFKGRSDD